MLPNISPPTALCSHSHRGQEPEEISGQPHKEKVKNLLHNSAAGINLHQGKKGCSVHLTLVKVGQSTPFSPHSSLTSFTYTANTVES